MVKIREEKLSKVGRRKSLKRSKKNSIRYKKNSIRSKKNSIRSKKNSIRNKVELFDDDFEEIKEKKNNIIITKLKILPFNLLTTITKVESIKERESNFINDAVKEEKNNIIITKLKILPFNLDFFLKKLKKRQRQEFNDKKSVLFSNFIKDRVKIQLNELNDLSLSLELMNFDYLRKTINILDNSIAIIENFSINNIEKNRKVLQVMQELYNSVRDIISFSYPIGSRPNQTPESWSWAFKIRMKESSPTGGEATRRKPIWGIDDFENFQNEKNEYEQLLHQLSERLGGKVVNIDFDFSSIDKKIEEYENLIIPTFTKLNEILKLKPKLDLTTDKIYEKLLTALFIKMEILIAAEKRRLASINEPSSSDREGEEDEETDDESDEETDDEEDEDDEDDEETDEELVENNSTQPSLVRTYKQYDSPLLLRYKQYDSPLLLRYRSIQGLPAGTTKN